MLMNMWSLSEENSNMLLYAQSQGVKGPLVGAMVHVLWFARYLTIALEALDTLPLHWGHYYQHNFSSQRLGPSYILRIVIYWMCQ